MFLTAGALVQGILLVVGVAWCVFIIRRLPNDLAELSRQFTKYRLSKDPHVLGTIKRGERRERYQKDCAREFWTTVAIQFLFFWPLTAFVLAIVASAIWGIVSRIVRAF